VLTGLYGSLPAAGPPKLGGTADAFLAMTQDVFYPQYWYPKQ
jgi:hypothetical protein